MRHLLRSPECARSRRARARLARARLTAAAVAPLLLVTLAACGDDDSSDAENSANSDTASASMSPSMSDSASGSMSPSSAPTSEAGTLVVAAATARRAVADSTAFSVDQQENGEWEVTLVTSDGSEQDVTVSSDGQSVTAGPVEDTDDNGKADRDERLRLLGVPVDLEAAVRAAAESAAGDGEPTGAELDEKKGTAVWEVQFGEDPPDGVTLIIDANTALVLRTDRGD